MDPRLFWRIVENTGSLFPLLKQSNLVNSGSLECRDARVNWKESVCITSSSCRLFSTHAFLNASLQNGSLFTAFQVFQSWQGGRVVETEGGGKEILIETWRHSLRQVVYRPTDSALRVLCRDAGVQSQKSKLFFSKLNCLRPLRGFIIPVRPV